MFPSPKEFEDRLITVLLTHCLHRVVVPKRPRLTQPSPATPARTQSYILPLHHSTSFPTRIKREMTLNDRRPIESFHFREPSVDLISADLVKPVDGSLFRLFLQAGEIEGAGHFPCAPVPNTASLGPSTFAAAGTAGGTGAAAFDSTGLDGLVVEGETGIAADRPPVTGPLGAAGIGWPTISN